MGTVKTTVLLSKAAHKKLKTSAAQAERTMGAVTSDLVLGKKAKAQKLIKPKLKYNKKLKIWQIVNVKYDFDAMIEERRLM